MFTTTLGWHVYHCTLQQLEQALLHTLATHVTRDAGVIALTGNLIYLVDEDNTTLGCLHVIVCHLEQSRENTLHILTHITSLGKHRGIDDGEGHVEQFGNGTSQQGFSRSCRSHHNNITLLDLHTTLISGLLQTLIVIVDSYREETLGLILSDDIVIEIGLDLLGFGHLLQLRLATSCLIFLIVYQILLDDTIGLLGTILTDIAAQTRDQQFNLPFAPSTETTFFLHSLLLPHQYFIDHTIFLGLLSGHPVVTVGVGIDLLVRGVRVV